MNLKVFDQQDFPPYLPKLSLLYDDLFTGGKGFRAQLIRKVSQHIGLSLKVQHLLSQTIEFIHNASLLHDDLVDRSQLRRGKTSAWLRFTPEYAVLAGDYLLARVMVNLSAFGNIKLVHYTAEMISDLLEGEWLQDSLINDFNVDLEQLDRVHNLKTASLFKWCLRAPFLAQERYESQIHSCFDELGTHLGQLFQRSDDLLDFNVRNDEGKNPLTDLKSGYLNSFGAFAAKKISVPEPSRSSSEPSRLRECATLEDFHRHVGGKDVFDQLVADFDQVNMELIDLYAHQLTLLSRQLKPNEKSLIQTLEPLTDLLYWRRAEKPTA